MLDLVVPRVESPFLWRSWPCAERDKPFSRGGDTTPSPRIEAGLPLDGKKGAKIMEALMEGGNEMPAESRLVRIGTYGA